MENWVGVVTAEDDTHDRVSQKRLYLGLVGCVFIAAALFFAGCPLPPSPPPVVVKMDLSAADFGIPDCPASVKPVSSLVCGTLSTVRSFPTAGQTSHLRCVACGVTVGCVQRDALVYCATSCLDPACH